MNFKDPTPPFVLASLGYLLAGAGAGLAMMSARLWDAAGGWDYYLLPSHAHLMLLGWVSMTIFGVAYRMFPAVFGRRLYSLSLARLHFWLANAALWGMVVFFFLARFNGSMVWHAALAASGLLQFSSILVFVYNMIRTVTAPPPGYGIREI